MKTVKSIAYIEHFRNLGKYLILAGIKTKPTIMYIILYAITAIIDVSLLLWILFNVLQSGASLVSVTIISLLMLTLVYLFIFLVVWLGFLMVVDYLKFKRKQAMEAVLPEFLRLVSTNHRAGLPLDTSIWKANKPRFGVLSEEINVVAKKTYSSGDLVGPLRELGQKYDSNLLRRVITNIIEGLKTGSDLAKLLDDISTNVTTIRNTRKELASEVENYMLFITLTVLIISPLMFALTHNMSGLIESVKDTLAENTAGAEQSPIKISLTKQNDFGKMFDLFVYLMIGTNSIVSVLLMSMVKYGNVKQNLKRIPIYYVICLTVYLVFKGFFQTFF